MSFIKESSRKLILTKYKPSLTLSPNKAFQKKLILFSETRKKPYSLKEYPSIYNKNLYSINSSFSKKKTQLNTTNSINISKKSHTIKSNNSPNKIFLKKNRNYINFVDRNKIRNIGLISLKLFDDYLDEKTISLKGNNQKSNLNHRKRYPTLYEDFKRNSFKANFFNTNSNVISVENDLKKKLQNLGKDHINNLKISYNNTSFLKNYDKMKNVRKKFSLHQLMEMNPYHYVSNFVKYSNSIKMKKISETLGNIHGADFNIKATSQRYFFKGQSYKNKKLQNKTNNRVINSFQVTFNTNMSHKSGLVWRILKKFKMNKNNAIPSFKHACKFKAYYELWKHHSMIIENLLVNYDKFKWFFEKQKFISEEVFSEFLECKKLEKKIKGELSFANKVFLAFDETCSGLINIKAFFLIMEITSKSNNNLGKINFISQLVETYENRFEEKSVNISDMYELFKYLIIYENSQKDLRNLYEAIKEDLNNGEKIKANIYVKKMDVSNFLLNNKFIHKLIQTFIIQYKYANVNYIEEINTSFNSTVRNVKKFLNEQNEVMCDSANNYYKFEQLLKSIQNKVDKKEKTKNIEDEFENDIIEVNFHFNKMNN